MDFDDRPPFLSVSAFFFDDDAVELVALMGEVQQPVACDLGVLLAARADEYDVLE